MIQSKKKILFINPNQFGHAAGYYHYCKHLNKKYAITFLCFDKELEKIELNSVVVIYIPYNVGKIKRLLLFTIGAIREAKKTEYKVVFSVYYFLSFVLGFCLRRKNVILDIRSGAVTKDRLKNSFLNNYLLFTTFFFKNITILSSSLGEMLDIKKEKLHVVPLGAEKITNRSTPIASNFNILYVGTFHNRQIEKTIQGFSLFKTKINNSLRVSYTIIGFGNKNEIKRINTAISFLNLEKDVTYKGRKTYDEVVDALKESNIGVSFIPKIECFQCQPPTKTFEYILAGLVCVATSTNENKAIINSRNGVLCDDTPESFCSALETIYAKRHSYNSKLISESLEKYQWKNIVHNNLIPYFDKTQNAHKRRN